MCIGHAFDRITMTMQIHDGHTGNLSYAPFQFTITRGHDVTFVLCDPLNDTVIGVGTLVRAWQAFETWIFGDTQSHTVLRAKLLDFTHHAIGDVRCAFGIQTIHHRLNDIELDFDGEVDEIRIDDDMIRRT